MTTSMPECLRCKCVVGEGTVVYERYHMCPECQTMETARWAYCEWDVLWAKTKWAMCTPASGRKCKACGLPVIGKEKSWSYMGAYIHFNKQRCQNAEMDALTRGK